jgi:TolB-like protein
MKNLSKCLKIIVGILALFLFACSGNPKANDNSGNKTLDQAIKEASERIDERIEPKTKIAILNISSPSDQFSAYVIDELTANFLDTRKLTVIDRKEIDLIRSELDFQFSGDVDDNSMQQLGKMLGAQNIISGSLMDIGGSYRIVIRALTVQTATVAVQYRTDITNDSRVIALLASGSSTNNSNSGKTGSQLVNISDNTPAPVPTPAVPANAAYKISDTGPAKGLIFYDKGNNSGGW